MSAVPRDRLRVLQVLPWLTMRAGGPVTAVSESAEVLAQFGIDSQIVATSLGDVWSLKGGQVVHSTELPANLDRLDAQLFDTRQPKRLAYSPELKAHIERVVADFDVVHIHSLWLYPQFAAFRSAVKAEVPYLVSFHGALDPYLRKRGRLRKWVTSAVWQDEMLANASAIHLTTDEENRLTAEIAPGVERYIAPIGVHVDAFDLEKGDPDAFRHRFFGGRTGPIVMFFGRITEKKGVDVLIRSFALVLEKQPDALLAIVGPDDQGLARGLTDIAEGLGLRDSVVFTGSQFGEDRRSALSAATVWALSSHSENFGIAVVEAMAGGIPTVITPQVNIASAAENAGAAVIAEADPKAFSDEVLKLLESDVTRESIAIRARQYANSLDWQVVAPELARMYFEVARRTGEG